MSLSISRRCSSTWPGRANTTTQHDHEEGENDPIGLILCGYKDSAVVELLLADPDSSPDKRIKIAQYLLLDSQEALKARLVQLSAAYDEAHDADDDRG